MTRSLLLGFVALVAAVALSACGGSDCASGQTKCGGTCVDLSQDASNCGACGNVCLSGTVCGTGACHLAEDFEASPWPWAPWTLMEGTTDGGSVTAACAHSGAQGLSISGGTASSVPWYERSDVTIGYAGDRLSWWVQTAAAGTTGRAYLGFGSTTTGGWEVVLASNTGELLLQSTTYSGYTVLATVAQSYSGSTWYKVEAVFGAGGAVTGNLYASDGTTLLNTVSATIAGFAPGGVAIRGFGVSCLDAVVGP